MIDEPEMELIAVTGLIDELERDGRPELWERLAEARVLQERLSRRVEAMRQAERGQIAWWNEQAEMVRRARAAHD